MAERIPFPDYTPVPRDKSWFCAGLLWPMLEMATRHDVTRCTYVPMDDGWELAVVETESAGTLEVNVTCDSEWAILKDVLSALEEIY